jgi:hypothetical protein
LKKSERAKRFKLVTTGEEDLKKKQRMERFGMNALDDDQKREFRAKRFKMS